MATTLLTNFNLNYAAPIDSRVIATNSAIRDAVQYKYDGLTVFQTDTRQSWTWNDSSATWSYNVAGNGIYGGSGSLVGNTYINVDIVGSSVGNSSKILGYYSVAGSNIVYLNNFLRRTSSGSTYQSLAYRIQLSADSTTLSYIEFNPDYTDPGAFAIGSGTSERFRINSNGKTGVLMTAYGQASFMVNGVASSEGIYISPDNSNTATVGGGYAILVDTSGSLKIRDTSPNSPDYINTATPGYQVMNIVGGKISIGGTTSISSYTPESRLEIYEPNALGTTTGSYLLLKTLTQNPQGAGIGNAVKVREWALRDKSSYSTNDWYSWRYHNAISVDTSFGDPTSSTRTFWEREIVTERQFFGSSGVKTLEIQSQSGGTHSLLLRNNASNKTFKWNDKYNVKYWDDSSTFIVEGVNRNINLSGTIVTFNATSFPANSIVTVEVDFSTTRRTSSSLFNRQNGIRAVYQVSSTFVVTRVEPYDDFLYDYSSNSAGINTGYTDFTSSQIIMGQVVTLGTVNCLSNASWKLTVIPNPATVFHPYTPAGNTTVNINGLI